MQENSRGNEEFYNEVASRFVSELVHVQKLGRGLLVVTNSMLQLCNVARELQVLGEEIQYIDVAAAGSCIKIHFPECMYNKKSLKLSEFHSCGILVPMPSMTTMIKYLKPYKPYTFLKSLLFLLILSLFAA